MSAYLNGADHIDLLVSAMIEHHVTGYVPEDPVNLSLGYKSLRVDHSTATEAGIVLITEQIASVSYLYPADKFEDLPGPINKARLAHYDHRPVYRPMTPLDVIAAVRGYQYQACEHPGWRTSMAKALTDALRDACIGRLPGMELANDKCWEWTRDPGEPEPISLADMARKAKTFRTAVTARR